MEVDREFHNRVAVLCLKRFETLPKSGKPKTNEWTVLSCVVLEFEGDLSVVALGTGSKCIGRTKLSPDGDVLNDAHAEVICRRSFLRFLLDRMKNAATFLSFNETSKKYGVREGVRFHFFTTHTPCGDASIFPMGGVEDYGEVVGDVEGEVCEDKDMPRKVARIGEEGDIFRTGAKCLAGGEKQDLKEKGRGYHVLEAVRTKPGRGDPTLSVSCSDKLARWCHLGVQGALLSLLLEEPVYLSTLTIAAEMPFSKGALKRALYDRLGVVELRHPYHQQKLIVGQALCRFDRAKDASKQPSDCSISWCDVEEKSLEVAVEGKRQGVTKKNLDTPSARLRICKSELFGCFVEVCELRHINLGLNCDVKTLSYKEVKNLAVDYNNCWKTLRKSFKVWTSKDVKLLHFSVE